MRKSVIFTIMAILLVFTSILAPMPDWLTNINITGSGGQLGLGRTQAADLSPVTVGTTQDSDAVLFANQRKVVYAASRFWVFYEYDNGVRGDLVVKSSLDGVTWSSAETLKTYSTGIDVSIWFDGTYIHVAQGTSVVPGDLQYCRYLPDEDGTLTASATWQTILSAPVSAGANFPSICVDSAGYPIISFSYDNTDVRTPYIVKSNQNDGTWSSDNFNVQLSASDYSYGWRTCVLPLSDNSLVAIYAQDNATIKSQFYDYSSSLFGSENTTTLKISDEDYYGGGRFSALVTSDDTVHLVFLEDSTGDIQYTTWTETAGAWDTEEEIYTGTSTTKAPVLSKTLDDNLYCFWMGDNATDHIFYKAQTAGVWDTTRTDWLTESGITDNASISVAYSQTTTDYIPVVWLTGSSPYNVRFAALQRDLEPWLTGYDFKQVMTIAPAVPSSENITVRIPTTGDTYLDKDNPTSIRGAMSSAWIRSGTTYIDRIIVEVDMNDQLGDLTSDSLISAAFYGKEAKFSDALDPVGRTWNMRRMRRGQGGSTHWVEGQATWSAYKTLTAWTSAGCSSTSDDYEDNALLNCSAIVPVSGNWMHWDCTALVLDAMENRGNYFCVRINDSSEGATDKMGGIATKESSNDPYLELVFTASPTALDNKVNVDIYLDDQTLEDGSWTVNNKTYNHRIPYTVDTMNAEILPDTYTLRVIINTETLVDGGYFSGSGTDNATTVEFASDNCLDDMPYWCPESTSGGVSSPRHFNTSTPGTTYFFCPQTTIPAYSTHTFYMYVDPDQSVRSSNYDPYEVVGNSGYFEHFDIDSDNLTDFLSKYTDWSNSPANTPIVSSDNSVVTVDSDNNSLWEGIQCSFGLDNYTTYFGYADLPGSWACTGMIDSSGITGANKDGVFGQWVEQTDAWYVYKNGSGTVYGQVLLTEGPFFSEINRCGDLILLTAIRETGNANNEPDTHGIVNGADVTAGEAHYPFIASFLTNDVSIDWILVVPFPTDDGGESSGQIRVRCPDITYAGIGKVFCGNHFYSDDWQSEIAFTAVDGVTELYWYFDTIAQITRQPGSGIRATVECLDAITTTTTICCYYGCASPCSTYQSAAQTYNTDTESYRWQSFDNTSDWTAASGSWSTTDAPTAMIMQGQVGNVGGGSGRLWERETTPVLWTDNTYVAFMSNANWEAQVGGWPHSWACYKSTAPSPEGPWSPAEEVLLPYWHHMCNPFMDFAFVNDNVCYVGMHGTDGFDLFYSTDLETWTANTNAEIMGIDWCLSKWPIALSGATQVMYHSIHYGDFDGSGEKYWAWIQGFIGSGRAGLSYWAYATDDPENWTNSSWTAKGPGPTLGDAQEDGDYIFDGDKYWYCFGLGGANFNGNCIVYCRLDTDSHTFPGTGSGDWYGEIGTTIEQPAWLYNTRSARLLEDPEGDYWLFTSGAAINESSTTRYCPNYPAALTSDNLEGSWSFSDNARNTAYSQGGIYGVNISYVTNSSKSNGVVQATIQLKTNQNEAGLLFRYHASSQNGYAATFDYQSGNPHVRLYQCTGGDLTEIGVAYDVPQYPIPWVTYGVQYQMKVVYYLSAIDVYLSEFGNDWIHCISYTCGTEGYYGAGAYGLLTWASTATFDDFSFSDYVDSSPYMSTTAEALDISINHATWTAFYKSGAGSSTNYLQESCWYTSEALGGNPSSGAPYFQITNGGYSSVDVMISSSDNWTGIGKTWTVSPIGEPGDATIGLWAGLEGSGGYYILIKPDDYDVFNFLVENLLSAGTQDFGLLVYTCTSNGGNATMTGQVVLTAVVHT